MKPDFLMWPRPNEGTHMPQGAPLHASSALTALEAGRVTEKRPQDATSKALDDRGDELMSLASSEGRPPTRWLRMMEWRWFGIGMLLITAITVTWLAIQGVSLGTVAAGLVFALVLLAAASPVLGAGLLRGREERAARKAARVEQTARINARTAFHD